VAYRTYQKQRRSPFSDSCLPLTLELATLLRESIDPLLPKTTSEWSFDDRVLAWLAPNLSAHVRRFYEANGPLMADTFPKTELGRLDRDLLAELVERVDRIQPGIRRLLAHAVDREP
jgi:hypothetical protein